jgi:hypothetical protein
MNTVWRDGGPRHIKVPRSCLFRVSPKTGIFDPWRQYRLAPSQELLDFARTMSAALGLWERPRHIKVPGSRLHLRSTLVFAGDASKLGKFGERGPLSKPRSRRNNIEANPNHDRNQKPSPKITLSSTIKSAPGKKWLQACLEQSQQYSSMGNRNKRQIEHSVKTVSSLLLSLDICLSFVGQNHHNAGSMREVFLVHTSMKTGERQQQYQQLEHVVKVSDDVKSC